MSFTNGEMTGPCTYWFENGDSYIGEFEGDDLNGAGTYKFADGTFFQGSFTNSTEATGVYTDEDGTQWNATIHEAVLTLGDALPEEPDILSDPAADEVISSLEDPTQEGQGADSSGASSPDDTPAVPDDSTSSELIPLTPEELTYYVSFAIDDCQSAVLDGEATFIIANEYYKTILDNAYLLAGTNNLKSEWLTVRENMVTTYNSIQEVFTMYGYEDYPIILYVFTDHVTDPRLVLAVQDGKVIFDTVALIAGWEY